MRAHLQTGCLILGILCLFYYSVIIVYAGWFTSISWIWLLGSGWFGILWKLLKIEQKSGGHYAHILVNGMLVLMLTGGVIFLSLGILVLKGIYQKNIGKSECVIVLGAQVRGTRPSRSLRMRLDAAYDYALENPDIPIILSGGQGPDEEIPEAICMKEYLLARGIPEHRLYLEDRSTSTKDNLIFSDEMYDLKEKKIGIISNDFHIFRALKLAEKLGYQRVCGIPASSDKVMQLHNIVREVFCILLAMVRGNLSLFS